MVHGHRHASFDDMDSTTTASISSLQHQHQQPFILGAHSSNISVLACTCDDCLDDHSTYLSSNKSTKTHPSPYNNHPAPASPPESPQQPTTDDDLDEDEEQPPTTKPQQQQQQQEPPSLLPQRLFSPPPISHPLRRSISHACHHRTPLDPHRFLPRAVTPEHVSPRRSGSGSLASPTSPSTTSTNSGSTAKLYSPMAAGFARLGQTHQQQRNVVSGSHGSASGNVSVGAAAAAAAGARRTYYRPQSLRESMALVARMFEGPA